MNVLYVCCAVGVYHVLDRVIFENIASLLSDTFMDTFLPNRFINELKLVFRKKTFYFSFETFVFISSQKAANAILESPSKHECIINRCFIFFLFFIYIDTIHFDLMIIMGNGR